MPQLILHSNLVGVVRPYQKKTTRFSRRLYRAYADHACGQSKKGDSPWYLRMRSRVLPGWLKYLYYFILKHVHLIECLEYFHGLENLWYSSLLITRIVYWIVFAWDRQNTTRLIAVCSKASMDQLELQQKSDTVLFLSVPKSWYIIAND